MTNRTPYEKGGARMGELTSRLAQLNADGTPMALIAPACSASDPTRNSLGAEKREGAQFFPATGISPGPDRPTILRQEKRCSNDESLNSRSR